MLSLCEVHNTNSPIYDFFVCWHFSYFSRVIRKINYLQKPCFSYLYPV